MNKWKTIWITVFVVTAGIPRGQSAEPRPASPQESPSIETSPNAPADSRAVVGTSFTYQGELRDNNVPVNASENFTFSLWDAAGSGCPPAGGTQLGASIPMSGVSVTDGLFTVLLNQAAEFGATPFDGNARWLQVSVNGTTLCPRQELTQTPYATRSLAPWVTSGANLYYSAGNVSVGTSANANKLDVEGGAAIGATYSGTSAAPTNGLIVQGNVGLGTTTVVNKLDVEGGAAIGATYSGTNTAPTNGLIVQGNVGVGVTAPVNKLDVEGGVAIGATYSGTNTVPTNGLLVEGSVGIGITSPDTKLAVNGDIAIPWGSALRTTDTAHDGRTILDINWDSTSGDYVEYYAPGVGLSNMVPQLRLSERKGVIVDPTATNDGNLGADTLGLRFGTGGSGEGIASKRTATGNLNGLDFYTNFVNRLAITNGGNVGINTTTPGSRLEVRATGARNAVAGYADTSNYSAVYGETSAVPLCNENSAGVRGVNAAGGVMGALGYGQLSGTCEFFDYYAVYGDGPSRFDGNVDVNGHFWATQSGGAVATFDRQTNDGTVISIRQGGVQEGSISVAGTTVSYNAFTGTHFGWTDKILETGTLVVLTGSNRVYHDRSEGEPIYGIAPSLTANDPRCMGAYLGILEPGQRASSDNPHQVMAVGNGEMWVCDESGDIRPGDYLISSDVTGHAMLDDENRFSVGYVVARAAEAVVWDSVAQKTSGRRHKRISVFFENFVRGSAAGLGRLVEQQQAQLRDLQLRIDALERTAPSNANVKKASKMRLSAPLALIGLAAFVAVRRRAVSKTGGA